jgi:hypothetical protein
MAVKHRNLFLYLTLACFLGLIIIFVFDGYMGVYDNLSITAGEEEQEIEADYWLRQDRDWSIAAMRGGKVLFRYEVDNRRFSSYRADVEVSVWHEQEKVAVLLAQPVLVDSFDKEQLEWALDVAELIPPDLPPEERYNFTVVIKRGEIERNIIIRVSEVPKSVIIEPQPPR